jgi:hypothetical protein
MSEREEIDAKVRTWRVVAVWIWARVREAEAAVGRSARDGSVMAEMLYEMPWRSLLAAVWSVVTGSLDGV